MNDLDGRFRGEPRKCCTRPSSCFKKNPGVFAVLLPAALFTAARRERPAVHQRGTEKQTVLCPHRERSLSLENRLHCAGTWESLC